MPPKSQRAYAGDSDACGVGLADGVLTRHNHFLGNKPLVDALLSRLRHQCHTLRIDGPELREPQG